MVDVWDAVYKSAAVAVAAYEVAKQADIKAKVAWAEADRTADIYYENIGSAKNWQKENH